VRDVTKAWIRATLLEDLLPGISKCIAFDLDEGLDALYFFCVEDDTAPAGTSCVCSAIAGTTTGKSFENELWRECGRDRMRLVTSR
jgi:hypothetical protein